ncbi:protein of unknown function [Methylocaldum szegediense]|uniref:Uncharacterized protein n=1 Tax=Methylocaldum szegediense TaxID=73780 RepID=A0ABM9HZX4_9GAMM|nr:protein of unknown function [Methylocaldum szegediense]
MNPEHSIEVDLEEQRSEWFFLHTSKRYFGFSLRFRPITAVDCLRPVKALRGSRLLSIFSADFAA